MEILFKIFMNTLKKKSIIIEIKGKQIRIEKNKFYNIKNLNFLFNKKIFINKILSFTIGNEFFIGTPYMNNIKIQGKLFLQINKPKIITYKMKPKKGIRKKKSYSEKMVSIYITGIFIKKNIN